MADWHDNRPGRGCQHRVYRLSCAAFDALYAESGGCCQRCSRAEEDSAPVRRRLVIDHDHSGDLTRVRGLLCYSCNRIMQYFDEGRRPNDVLSARYASRSKYSAETS